MVKIENLNEILRENEHKMMSHLDSVVDVLRKYYSRYSTLKNTPPYDEIL